MKKLFAILFSIWIPLYLLFALLASCEKSTVQNEPQLKEAASTIKEPDAKKNDVLGSWQLVEYYQDNGDGTGKWIAAELHEDIKFSDDGTFHANSQYPVFNIHNYTQYRIVDSASIDLFGANSEPPTRFHYTRENETSLIFHPVCRENCSRRYKLIQ